MWEPVRRKKAAVAEYFSGIIDFYPRKVFCVISPKYFFFINSCRHGIFASVQSLSNKLVREREREGESCFGLLVWSSFWAATVHEQLDARKVSETRILLLKVNGLPLFLDSGCSKNGAGAFCLGAYYFFYKAMSFILFDIFIGRLTLLWTWFFLFDMFIRVLILWWIG